MNKLLTTETETMRCLADMAQATARLSFATVQAQHDMQSYGEWRCDYAVQAAGFQADYEKAGRDLRMINEFAIKEKQKDDLIAELTSKLEALTRP